MPADDLSVVSRRREAPGVAVPRDWALSDAKLCVGDGVRGRMVDSRKDADLRPTPQALGRPSASPDRIRQLEADVLPPTSRKTADRPPAVQIAFRERPRASEISEGRMQMRGFLIGFALALIGGIVLYLFLSAN